MPRTKQSATWRSERGFTLPEVLAVIAIMGILAAIAIPMWGTIVDSRRVDSAANQLASDLRLAHTRATNQLVEWRLVYSHNNANYTLVSASSTNNRSFEDAQILGSEVGGAATKTIRFRPEGNVVVDAFADADVDGELDIVVSTTDGSPQRVISLNPATSRIVLD